MLQSLYTGITGIKTTQSWMDVIGNNVSNTQTIGFKKDRVTFEDLLYLKVKHAYGPREGRGGEDPKQVGTGVANATIQHIHTPGPIENTGKETDIFINGEGYFVLKEVACHLNHYTRAGAFDFDGKGNLVNPSNGFFVQGWMAELKPNNQLVIDPETREPIIDVGKPLQNIRRPNELLQPMATKKLEFSRTLNKDQRLPIDPIMVKLTSPVKSTEEVVKRNYGFDREGHLVQEDEDGFWWYLDGEFATKPDVVRNALDTAKPWKYAGFEQIPTGDVTINGATFRLSDYTLVNDFINAVNRSSQANVTLFYNQTLDKWILKNDILGRELRIEENVAPGSGVGFFTESNIPIGTIKPRDISIQFKHLFEPQNPDNLYFRFTPVDPKTHQEITTEIHSTGEVQYGREILDTTKTIKDVFLEHVPNGTITINDYTSRPISEYASLDALMTEINNSPDARAILSYDSVNDRFALRNKHSGENLRISEEAAPPRIGARVEGRFLDDVNGHGKVDGKIIGRVDGKIEFGSVIGTVKGRVIGISEGEITGAQVGRVDGKIEGQGMFSGSAVVFNGFVKGDVTHINLDTPKEQAAYIDGRISGSAVGTMIGDFGKIPKDRGRVPPLQPYTTVSSYDFKLDGAIRGYLVADGNVEGLVLGSAVGVVEGHVQGMAGSATVVAADMDGDGVYDDLTWRINKKATITGDVVGTAVGKINGIITGKIWDVHGNYIGQVYHQRVDMSGVVSGRIKGALIEGCAIGSIDGKIVGEVGSAITHGGTYALIRGKVKGEIGGIKYVDVRGHVYNDEKNDHISAIVSVTGRLVGTAVGYVVGTVQGAAYGKIEGLVKHGYITAQKIDGTGQVAGNIQFEGKIIGSLSSAIDTADDRISDTIETIAGRGAQITGTIKGRVQVIATAHSITGVANGEIHAVEDDPDPMAPKDPYQDTKYAIEGRIVGEIDGYGSIRGDYKGYATCIGRVDGKIDGIVSAPSMAGMPPPRGVAKFEGVVKGTISGRIVGFVDGHVVGVGDVKGDMDITGTVIGTVKGTVENLERQMGPIIVGKAEGIAEGAIKGLIDAEEIEKPGFFTRIHMPLGEKNATSGILQLDSDPESPTYGKVINCFRDPDANSCNPTHRLNHVLDLTSEIPNEERFRWMNETVDGKNFFTVNMNGNDVAIVIPNGVVGPELIRFSPLEEPSEEAAAFSVFQEIKDFPYPIIETDWAKGGEARLKKTDEYIYYTSIPVYDSLGNAFNLIFNFERMGTNTWLWYVRNPVERDLISGYGIARFNWDGTYNKEISDVFQSPSDPRTFDGDDGAITGETRGEKRTIGYRGIYIDPPDTPYPMDQAGSPPAEYGAEAMRMDLDFSDLLQYADHTSQAKIKQDGWAKGILKDIKFDDLGVMIGEYSNGKNIHLARLALATFINPSGLMKVEGTMFLASPNSGEPRIGTPGTERRGTLAPRALEKSNVDITEEFVNMLLAERSFQVSSRTITTGDRMLMELMRLRT